MSENLWDAGLIGDNLHNLEGKIKCSQALHRMGFLADFLQIFWERRRSWIFETFTLGRKGHKQSAHQKHMAANRSHTFNKWLFQHVKESAWVAGSFLSWHSPSTSTKTGELVVKGRQILVRYLPWASKSGNKNKKAEKIKPGMFLFKKYEDVGYHRRERISLDLVKYQKVWLLIWA